MKDLLSCTKQQQQNSNIILEKEVQRNEMIELTQSSQSSSMTLGTSLRTKIDVQDSSIPSHDADDSINDNTSSNCNIENQFAAQLISGDDLNNSMTQTSSFPSVEALSSSTNSKRIRSEENDDQNKIKKYRGSGDKLIGVSGMDAVSSCRTDFNGRDQKSLTCAEQSKDLSEEKIVSDSDSPPKNPMFCIASNALSSGNSVTSKELYVEYSTKTYGKGADMTTVKKDLDANANDNCFKHGEGVTAVNKRVEELQKVLNVEDSSDSDSSLQTKERNVAQHEQEPNEQSLFQQNKAEVQLSLNQKHLQKDIHISESALVQPAGWRVKLYRLNADGSWDDCGTGRIMCLQTPLGNNENGAPKLNVENKRTDECKIERRIEGRLEHSQEGQSLEEEIYREIGEPILYMRAEKNVPSDEHQQLESTDKDLEVLLQTRVLLQDTYQRQGDCIITWCEPFSSSPTLMDASYLDEDKSNNREEHPSGVDLALSFQDNAGCLDVWNKITTMRNRWREILQSRRTLLHLPNERETFTSPSKLQQEETENQNEESKQQEMIRHRFGVGNIAADVGNTAPPPNSAKNKVSSLNESSGTATGVDSPTGCGNNLRTLWNNVASNTSEACLGTSSRGISGINFDVEDNGHEFVHSEAVAMAAEFVGNEHTGGNNPASGEILESNQILNQLPKPPKLSDLESIAVVITGSQPQQWETIASFLFQSDCAYFLALLALFPAAEAKEDYNALATLASIIKSIILLNCPDLLEIIASDGEVFENCCCCLEYDPTLRDKANHRWFIRDRLKFRTVLPMEDDNLIKTIHKSFRLTYIRDTLLRPTMDESSLQTLGSILDVTQRYIVTNICRLQTFTNENKKSDKCGKQDSYLLQIIRLLGNEIRDIRNLEWQKWQNSDGKSRENFATEAQRNRAYKSVDASKMSASSPPDEATGSGLAWKQHLAPQDHSLSSRKIRRRGCLFFLRELFNMIRVSVDQSDKNDFFARTVIRDVSLTEEGKQMRDSNHSRPKETVNLLSLLGAILSDPNTDVSERGACLEILSAIAMHNPSFIRKQCLEEFSVSENDGNMDKQHLRVAKPQPNDRHQVIFNCPPNDLLLSLLFVMAVETDAGIMLQASEIIRVVLEAEVLNESCQMGGAGVIDNGDEPLGSTSGNGSFHGGYNTFGGGIESGSERNSFLQVFFDHYVAWLVAPFQYCILVSCIPFPLLPRHDNYNSSTQSQEMYKIHEIQKNRAEGGKEMLQSVIYCAVRASFSIELLCFCVRAHSYRVKQFLLTSRVLANVLKLLSSNSSPNIQSGDRCLKLASLRCLRSILMLKDEKYHRHIIQQNLFAPVFDAYRVNPVGDNLISSAIIEICDYIKNENIKSLLEYIVTKYIRQQQRDQTESKGTQNQSPTLEEVSTPYVNTLTHLREKYEENMASPKSGTGGDLDFTAKNSKYSQDTFDSQGSGQTIRMSEKAIEDQRKFREGDEEDSYFNDDDDDDVEENILQVPIRPPSPVLLGPPTKHHSQGSDVKRHSFLDSSEVFCDSSSESVKRHSVRPSSDDTFQNFVEGSQSAV